MTVLPAHASSAASARGVVRASLEGCVAPDAVDTLELLVCELVTNAFQHAGTPLQLRLSQPRAGVARVEVTDGAVLGALEARVEVTDDGLPASRDSGWRDSIPEGGRGLALVEALAAAWGVEHHALGKTVWLEVHADPADAAVEGAD